MKSMKNIFRFLSIGLAVLLNSCNKRDLDVNISSVKLPLNFYNLDSIEFNTENAAFLKSQILKGDYRHDEIISYQFNYCLSVGRVSDDSTFHHLKMFTGDPYFQRVNKAVQQQLYPNLPKYNSQISDGFKRLKYHNSGFKFPESVIYINSAFSSSVFSTEHEIGVSLERYLSDSVKVIQELPADPFYDWVKKKFNRKFLVRDVLLGWITTHIVSVDNGNLAEKMIQHGKALYLLKAALPKEKDALILRYDDVQYRWARENEWNFWDFLVKQKLLYTTNERDQSNFLNDGPYTMGLPETGPDRMGQFLGLQMIISYLDEHPKTTLKELIKLPYTEIIKEYKVE